MRLFGILRGRVVILFVVVLVIGVFSYRFRSGGEELSEWGLGGRGTVITWFLVGGDLYTAYTLIAVPGLIRDGGYRLLRVALHHHRLPAGVPDHAQVLADCPE